jgi:YedE family putative selenium metabolism protein
VGITIGTQFLKAGYNLGRAGKAPAVVGWIMPVVMLGLLLLRISQTQVAEGGPLFSSEKGPGSLHAPLLVSLGVALVIGFLAQRTRFCTMGAIRDVALMRDTHLLKGVAALVGVAFVTNLILGQVKFGFAGQPVAHSSYLWNFTGMVLSGLAFALAGGCPGRQLFLAGEGDSDAGVFVLGMITGAAFAHNFTLAASADSLVEGVVKVGGLNSYGMSAVILGLVVCAVLGLTLRAKEAK